MLCLNYMLACINITFSSSYNCKIVSILPINSGRLSIPGRFLGNYKKLKRFIKNKMSPRPPLKYTVMPQNVFNFHTRNIIVMGCLCFKMFGNYFLPFHFAMRNVNKTKMLCFKGPLAAWGQEPVPRIPILKSIVALRRTWKMCGARYLSELEWQQSLLKAFCTKK